MILDSFAQLLTHRTKPVALIHVSNAPGTGNPVEQLIALPRRYGAPVLVDGAQSTPHMPIDVQAMDCDFFVFSGHKIFGSTAIGVFSRRSSVPGEDAALPGRREYDAGCDRCQNHCQGIQQKFETGTQGMADVVGLIAAIDYRTKLGMPTIAAYEHELLQYAARTLASVHGLRPIGTATHKASALALV